MKESPFMEEYEEMMSKVTREGLALGYTSFFQDQDQVQ